MRYSRSAVGSPNSLAKMMEEYRATDFISIFQKFKLAFNLLVSITILNDCKEMFTLMTLWLILFNKEYQIFTLIFTCVYLGTTSSWYSWSNSSRVDSPLVSSTCISCRCLSRLVWWTSSDWGCHSFPDTGCYTASEKFTLYKV